MTFNFGGEQTALFLAKGQASPGPDDGSWPFYWQSQPQRRWSHGPRDLPRSLAPRTAWRTTLRRSRHTRCAS